MSLKYAVLGLLSDKPRYGYELKKQFEDALANAWSLSYGQLYPTLHALSASGLVTRKTERGRKAAEKTIYSITEKGRKSLDEWLLKPVSSAYRVKDEFTLRFLFLSKLPRDTVVDYLGAHLKRIIQQKEGFQRTLDSLKQGSDYYLTAIMRKGVFHLEADIRWLQETIAGISPR
jgi:PadR family transcriptional regulator, regulatory protein AphA